MLEQDRFRAHGYRKGAAGILALTLATAPAAVRAADEPEAPIAATMDAASSAGDCPFGVPEQRGARRLITQ
ncbi:MAG TPA: hypothetical protein VF425_04935, partial [Thermoanaerobaculia bacterium]